MLVASDISTQRKEAKSKEGKIFAALNTQLTTAITDARHRIHTVAPDITQKCRRDF